MEFMSQYSEEIKEIVKKEEQKMIPKNEENEEEEEEAEIEPIGSFSKNMNKLNSGLHNFFENLKNYININTVYQILQANKSTKIEDLWNIIINNYDYDDGILITKDKSKDKKDSKNVDQNASNKDENNQNENNQNENNQNENNQNKNDINKESNINDNGTKKVTSNLNKIMKYDEQKHCWQFFESDLEKMVNKSNDNPVIPLILFINSKTDDIKNVLSSVTELCIEPSDRKNKLEFISDDDEISLYSFWKETPYVQECGKDFPNTITEPMFLYVYIPKSKEKHKNIGTILYQIYTFLFMICDVSFVIINDKYFNMQLLLMKEIISISKLYLKDQQNDSQIFFNKSKITFLHISKEDKSKKLNKLIEQSINIDYNISYLKNEEEFRLMFKNLSFSKCYRYSNLVSTLNQVNSLFSQISSLYLYMRKEKNIYILVKEILTKRYDALKEKNGDNTVQMIKAESYNYFPKNDDHVSKTVSMVALNICYQFNQFDNTRIKTELNEQSKINLEYIKKKLNQKYYWSPNQLIIIRHSHMNYLEKQFFEIVKKNDQSNLIDVIYERCLDVLEAQKLSDSAELMKIFASFTVNINKKQEVVKDDFDESSKKGTNYVIKEVETVREIEVICEAGEGVDSIIEQDF